jgi:hypothetical protein
MAGAKVPLTFRIFKGDQLIREERLSLGVIKLGKVPSAHLKLDDETVSRMHAIIEVNSPEDVSIIDLGSTKGTFVNGQKVNKAKLQSGDMIMVGETRIELAIGSSEEVASEPPTRVNRPIAESAANVVVSTSRLPTALQPSQAMQPVAPPTMRPNRPPPIAAPQGPVAPPPVASAPPEVRPAPGIPTGPAMYGTAMASPVGFQQAMAGSVDEIGGGRAIEVAAMLGDSVVGVKHCIDPRSGKVTPVTYATFAIAICMLLLFGFAFYKGVDNAAWNKGQEEYLTTCMIGGKLDPKCRPRPIGKVSHRWLWEGYDWFAFGGLALSLTGFTIGLSRLRKERQSPWVRIGTGPNVDFASEAVPQGEFPLVAPHGDDFAFNFVPGMEGEMIVGGQSTTLAELAAQHRTSIHPIPPNAKIRVRSGKSTFLISSVPQPRRYISPLFAALETQVLVYFAGSAIVHLGIWALLQLVPPEDGGISTGLASNEDASMRAQISSAEDPPPPVEDKKDGSDESGGSGAAMELPEGKMGKKDSDRAEGQYKMKNENVDPQLARLQATEQARTAGFLGSTALTEGGAFAALTGTGNISSGFDDSNIYGGLSGNEAGEMNGCFGCFGRAGFGPGGGGNDVGVGTGRYGTIGHGRGTGAGYGVGGGRGGMGGRSSAVPTVSIGQPSATGDLDKAIIRRYIKRNIQKIQYCYEKQLLAKPDLSGTVQTQFFITPNGTVASASASGVDPEVASCVAGVVKDIEFPKPKGGGGVQVNYPFIFRPAGS